MARLTAGSRARSAGSSKFLVLRMCSTTRWLGRRGKASPRLASRVRASIRTEGRVGRHRGPGGTCESLCFRLASETARLRSTIFEEDLSLKKKRRALWRKGFFLHKPTNASLPLPSPSPRAALGSPGTLLVPLTVWRLGLGGTTPWTGSFQARCCTR